MREINREQFVTRVLANVPLCREHYRLVLGLSTFPPTEPGQFIQISCCDLDEDLSPTHEFAWEAKQQPPEGRELSSPLAMLRRPFSLAGRRDTSAGVELDIIHRVVGVGTDWLSHLCTGDRVHILGPLGNRFILPDKQQLAILIGGGVGIPPMLYLATALAGRNAIAFCGALSRDLLPLTIDASIAPPGPDSFDPLPAILEFASQGIRSVITTDDGTYGFRGYVTQALERFLEHTLSAQHSALSTPPILYTCGPEPMMKRVAEIAAERGLSCQIAVERAMACGMGTCQSCCIRVRKPVSVPPLKGRDWAYRLACTDGPVFYGADLLW